jgi:AcrR family transcriptional regulator
VKSDTAGVPVGRKPVQARAIARVESILAEAGSIIAAEGIDGMTMTRVAEASGIPIGSLYQYFPTEASLVAGLAERHLRKGHERLLRDIGSAACVAEMPDAMQRALKTYLRVTEDMLSAELMAAIRADPRLRAMDRADTARNADEIVKALGMESDTASLRIGLVIDLAGHLALDLPNEAPARRRQLMDAFVDMAVSVLSRDR